MITTNAAPIGIGKPPQKPLVDIETLIKRKLPPLSNSVFRILDLLRDENVTTRELANAVGFDPVLAARLLKLANSSLYFRRNPVISISQGVETLGRRALYDMVMLGAMADGFAKEIVSSFHSRQIWEHSVATGLIAREISNILGMRGTEEAFLCGLLHDIGKILLLKAEPQAYETVLNCTDESEMLDAEVDIFGFTHAEVGAYVSHKWKLPEVVCSVIMHHHRPRLAQVSNVITHIVNVADTVANFNNYGVRLGAMEELNESDSRHVLRLEMDKIHQAEENVGAQMKEVMAAFSL